MAAAQSTLDEVAAQTGETVNLCALVDDFCVCVDYRLPHQDGLVVSSRLGKRAFLHAEATPKAVLAFLPPDVLAKVAASLPLLPKYTERTVREPYQLYEEIRLIRQRGYAISDEDFQPGARGVGAPIFGGDGRPLGGLSAGAPTARMTVADLEERFAPVVMRGAQAISRVLGFSGHWREQVPSDDGLAAQAGT